MIDFSEKTKVFDATDNDVVNGTLVVPDGKIMIIFDNLSDPSEIKKIVFPKSFKIIPADFAKNLSNLQEVEFGGNETIIGERAFAGTKIKELVIPSSVQETRREAFGYCPQLEKVTLSSNKNSILIGDCFVGSENIKKLTIPEGLKYLTNDSFSKNKITSLVIPKSCRYFSMREFADNLQNLEMHANTNLSDFYEKNLVLKNLIVHTDSKTFTFSGENGVEIIDSEKSRLLVQISGRNNDRELYIVENDDTIQINTQNFDFVMDKVASISDIVGARIAKMLQNGEITSSQVKNANGRIINCCLYDSKEDGIKTYFEAQKSFFICKKFVKESDAICTERLLYKTCKVLGLFQQDPKVRNKIVGTFAELKELEKKDCCMSSLFYAIDELNEAYNQYFAEFLLKNYREIIRTGALNILPFAQENFDDIRTSYKNKSGKLKVVTLEAINQYFVLKNLGNLDGVDDIDFVKSVAKYFVNQVENIPTLYKFHKEAMANQKAIDDGKLEDYFGGLIDDKDNKYTFEFLRKDKNEFVILGNICDCCARVGGVGESILYDTCVDYKRTFLAIRNERNEIVGKCSLTYQPNENVLVFNNIEINQFYKSTEMTTNDKMEMLDCLQRAVDTFKDNISTNRPFACIIGTNLTNDLHDIILARLQKVNHNIHVVAYSNYDPDATSDQHYIFKDEDFKEEEWTESAYMRKLFDRFGVVETDRLEQDEYLEEPENFIDNEDEEF